MQLKKSVRDQDVFVISSPSPPAIDDHVMETLVLLHSEHKWLAVTLVSHLEQRAGWLPRDALQWSCRTFLTAVRQAKDHQGAE